MLTLCRGRRSRCARALNNGIWARDWEHMSRKKGVTEMRACQIGYKLFIVIFSNRYTKFSHFVNEVRTERHHTRWLI